MTDDFDDSFRTRKVHELLQGVSIAWLTRAFGLNRHEVEKRLRNQRPIDTGNTGEPLYDFREAASHLVDPKVDVESYVASLKPDQIPLRWRESYWNAELKRQKWEANAGQLWHTEQVIDALSEVFGTVRTNMQLIPDTLENVLNLDSEERQKVVEVIDGAQDEIHQSLILVSKQRQTYPQKYDNEFVREDSDDV